ncbi:MAG: hypothetical protein HY919_07585 [Elusimicrobia bacterium]|nr:hypothetical protein [Elusimicrobiota bacterium]
MQRKQYVLLKEYEKWLKGRPRPVNEETVKIYIRRANTMLEAIVSVLPEKIIWAIIEEAKLRQSMDYDKEFLTVFRQLHKIAENRKIKRDKNSSEDWKKVNRK